MGEHSFQSGVDLADFLGGSEVLYQPNVEFEITEKLTGQRIPKDHVSFYRKLQNIHHRHIREVVDVIPTNHFGKDEALVLFNGPSSLLIEDAGKLASLVNIFKTPNLETKEFRLLVSCLLEALIELHENQMYHGNIKLSSVYVYHSEKSDVYQLGDFLHNEIDVDIEQQKRQDYSNLGNLLDDLQQRLIHKNNWPGQYEILDLIEELKNGDFENGVKEKVYQTPAMLSHRDHPLYVIQAWDFLRSRGVNPTDNEVLTDSNWFDNIGSQDFKNLLMKRNAVLFERNKPRLEKHVDRRASSFLNAVRGCLAHYKQNVDVLSKMKIHGTTHDGETMSSVYSVFRYFRNRQPKILAGLSNCARRHGFVFHSYNQKEELAQCLGLI